MMLHDEDRDGCQETHVLVFAYGSNMCTRRMRARVPSATPLMIGYVRHRRLVFHKRSEDGSAKADAVRSSSPTDYVWGVVYRLHQDEKPALDAHEFLGIGYEEEQVEIIHERGCVQAWLYVARQDAIDGSLNPYSWYHDLVTHGARQHGLPNSYLEFLQSFDSIVDPNTARHSAHRQFLQG